MGHLVYRFALYFQTNEIKIKALISWFLLNYLLQKELFHIISSHGSISMRRLVIERNYTTRSTYCSKLLQEEKNASIVVVYQQTYKTLCLENRVAQ